MGVRLYHAFSRWSYERTADGLVLVTQPNGSAGLFKPNGVWVSGEITDADVQIICFVGGRHAQRDPNRPDPGTRLASKAK
jgi:hypothetical protein